jgi:hypothetical protein
MRALLILFAICLSGSGFAQDAPPKVGNKSLMQIRPKATEGFQTGRQAHTAIAQPGTCRAIKDSDERLACYDKANPPAKRVFQKRDAYGGGDTTYIDEAAKEDARMKKVLGPICRNC